MAKAFLASMSLESDSRWERTTWPKLKRLADKVPEAGIHFQSSV
jgi:D-amino-acid oxidase